MAANLSGTGGQAGKSVAIVGSGLSGLTAACLLHRLGFRVTVFEAAERIGGRVFSVWEGRTQLAMGAMWLHGGRHNPLYGLISRLGLLGRRQDNLADVCDQTHTYQYDWSQSSVVTDSGQPVDAKLAHRAELTVRRLLAEAGELPAELANGLYGDRVGGYVDSRILAYTFKDGGAVGVDDGEAAMYGNALRTFALFYANVEGVHSLHDLSILGDSDYDGGPEGQCLVDGGMVGVAEALAAVLPAGCIRLRSEVERVSVSSDGSARLLVNPDWLSFDHALVTVSLGVLQAQRLVEPSLLSPDWLAALDQLQLGVVDKIFVRFSLPVSLPDGSNHLWIVRQKLCRNWLDGLTSVTAVNSARDIFILWLSGQYAREMEAQSLHQVEAALVPFLEAALRRRLPRVAKIWRSSYASNPHFLGSYSSYKPGGRSGANAKLAEPVIHRTSGLDKPVICFAGEHTSERHYATVQGACLSGIREARRIASHYRLETIESADDLAAML